MTRFVRTTGFQRGEVDESLYDREDVEFYTSASRSLLNWFPDRIGGLRRRTPTQHADISPLEDWEPQTGSSSNDFGPSFSSASSRTLLSATSIVFEFRGEICLIEVRLGQLSGGPILCHIQGRKVTLNGGRWELGALEFARDLGTATSVDHVAQEIDYAQIGPAMFISSTQFPPVRVFFNASGDIRIADLRFYRELIGQWAPTEDGNGFEAEDGTAVAESEIESGDTIIWDRQEFEVDAVQTEDSFTVVGGTSGLIRKADFAAVLLPDTNGAFGGNPRYVSANKGRLCFAATESRPTGVWASKPNEPFIMFSSAVFDDSAIDVELLDAGLDEIRWMSGRDILYIGGGQAEFAIGEADQPLVPSNFGARRVGSDGSSRVRPAQTGSEIYFINEPGTQLVGVQFDFSTQGFISTDLSLLAPHLTAPTVRQVAFRPSAPYDRTPRVFMAKRDAQLCCLALDRAQDVVAWSSVQFPPEVEIEAVSAGTELVAVQYRTKDQLGLAFFLPEPSPECYLDLQVEADEPEDSVVEIPSIYEGFFATAWSSEQGVLDRFEIGENQTEIDLSEFGTPEELGRVVVGLRYRSEVEMLAGAFDFGNGSVLSRRRRLVRAIVSLRDTRELAVNGQPLLGQTPYADNQIPPKRTGQFERRQLGWGTDDALTFSVEGVYPATVLSVVREYSG